MADPKPPLPQPGIVDLTESGDAPVVDDTALDIFDGMIPEDLELPLAENVGVGGSADNDALLEDPLLWMLTAFDDSNFDDAMKDLVV